MEKPAENPCSNHSSTSFRCGLVTVLGKPNVGKSTLLNRLIGQKISIVTPKAQTTRRRILGILHREDMQIVFADTPGVIQPGYLLHEKMMAQVDRALRDADVVLMMVEPQDHPDMWERPPLDRYRMRIQNYVLPVVLFINKIDLLPEGEWNAVQVLWEGWCQKQFSRYQVIPGSALQGTGISSLLSAIQSFLPEGPPLFPPDQITDIPLRILAAEIIREKIFLHFRQEVPYATEVEVEEFQETPDRIYIYAVIYVERDSQKKILIGKQGSALTKIGKEARLELQHLLGRPVYLRLYVKVRPRWRKNERFLRNLGY